MKVTGTDVKILSSAAEVFIERGFRKSKMDHVADAAGVSRQTLYAHFKTKDELLAAVMRAVIASDLDELKRGWSNGEPSIQNVLETYFETVVRKPFMLMQKHPDFQEVMQGAGPKTTDVAVELEQLKSSILADCLNGLADTNITSDDQAKSIAKYVVRVSKDLKVSCTTLEELDEMLALLKASVCKLVS